MRSLIIRLSIIRELTGGDGSEHTHGYMRSCVSGSWKNLCYGKGVLHLELGHRRWDTAPDKTKMRQEKTEATNSMTSNLCLGFSIGHTETEDK